MGVHEDTELHTEQPMPNPRPGVPSIQAAVRADLDVREQVGIQRYGTSLKPHNGRDALRDLYEELLDGVMYAKQLLTERDGTGPGPDGLAPGRVFEAPFGQLITNFRDYGDSWSWRCGLLTASNEDYRRSCKFDHLVDGDRDDAIREATEHLVKVHGIYPTNTGAPS